MSGETELYVNPLKGAGNSYVVSTGASVTLPAKETIPGAGWVAWDGADEIEATTGHMVGVVEVDSEGKAKKGGIATVTAAE